MFLRDDYGGVLDTDSANLLRTTIVKAFFSTQAHDAGIHASSSCPILSFLYAAISEPTQRELHTRSEGPVNRPRCGL